MASTDYSDGVTKIYSSWLNDVDAVTYGSGSTTGQILTSTGDGTLATFQAVGTVVANLDDIGDVTITSADSGDYIRYNGSAWVDVASSQIITDINATLDHGTLAGLSDDDHSLYLLASDATNRATFATNWTDLTDAGATTLHKHDHGGMDGLTDDDHTQYLLADGTRALSADWNAGTNIITSYKLIAGEPGTESTGITIGGVTYNAHLKASDINDDSLATFHVHNHSTTVGPTILTSRSHSTGSSHAVVSDGDNLGWIVAAGYDGADYALGGYAGFFVDGTPGAGDMPTEFLVATSADGSEAPSVRLRAAADGTVTFNEAFKFPAADGAANQVMVTDGAGVISWANSSGGTVDVAQSTHGFSVGDVLYYTGSQYAKAVASAASTAEVAGIVKTVTDSNNFVLLVVGSITGLSGLTAGTVYFLDPSTAGALTSTEPTTVGQISKPLLIANSTTSGIFFNWRGSTVGNATSTFAQDIFSGDGSTTGFTLSATPVSENNVLVFVSGVRQQTDTYSVSGTTLTFSTAPPSGTSNIEAITIGSVSIGTASATDAGATLTHATPQSSTSGTSIDFTGIPSGTKEIRVMWTGVSFDAAENLSIRLGTSGGFASSGYLAAGGYVSSSGTASMTNRTDLFHVSTMDTAAATISGMAVFTHLDSNTWSMIASSSCEGTVDYLWTSSGTVALSGELTQLRLLGLAGNSFDAGTINIAYK